MGAFGKGFSGQKREQQSKTIQGQKRKVDVSVIRRSGLQSDDTIESPLPGGHLYRPHLPAAHSPASKAAEGDPR